MNVYLLLLLLLNRLPPDITGGQGLKKTFFMFITGVNDTGKKLFSGANDTGEKNLSPLSLTPAINPCHGFSVIAGINHTGDQLSPVTMTPEINLLLVTTTLVKNFRR